MLTGFEEVFDLLRDDAAQSEEGDHVRDGHQTVEDVGDLPYGFDRHVRSDEDSEYVQPAVYLDRFHPAAGEVLKAALGVVVPSEDSREREEYEACHKHEARDCRRQRKSVLECIRRYLYAFESFYLPCACEDDRKTCHRADDDGVDECSGHADEALSYRLVRLGCSCCDGRASQAGFVREDAAGNALLHSYEHRSNGASRHCFWSECGFYDDSDRVRYFRNVADQEKHREHEIYHRHEGYNDLAYCRDPLESAYDNGRDAESKNKR